MKLLLVCSAVLHAGFAYAVEACWQESAGRHGVDPLLLKAIGWQESRGLPDAVGVRDRQGNYAIGLMQIYTTHLPELKNHGIGRKELFDACTSIEVGARVLSDCIQRFGGVWKAVGCYYTGPNSKNVKAQAWYVNSVKKHYENYRKSHAMAQNKGSE